MGCSQGGFVSALVAAKNKYPIEKLVLFYPALCIPDDARAGKMMMTRFDPQNIPEILHCGPMKLGKCYPMDVMNMDPFEQIKSYTGKVCIVHETKDKIVDLTYAKKAFDAYKSNTHDMTNADEKIKLHIIKGGTHIFLKNTIKLQCAF